MNFKQMQTILEDCHKGPEPSFEVLLVALNYAGDPQDAQDQDIWSLVGPVVLNRQLLNSLDDFTEWEEVRERLEKVAEDAGASGSRSICGQGLYILARRNRAQDQDIWSLTDARSFNAVGVSTFPGGGSAGPTQTSSAGQSEHAMKIVRASNE